MRSQGTWFHEISGLHLRVGENGKLVVRQMRPPVSLEVMEMTPLMEAKEMTSYLH